MNEKIFTVSEISQQVRNCLETQFSSLWIKGELSNFIAHSSGHWYFSLKDEHSQIKGAMFRRQNQNIKFQPKTGEEVLVQGSLSVYPPRGDYQIICYNMEIVGSGSLQVEFERLKNKLQQEGLFDKERKRPLPLFPKHIALITSPTGAAVRDILQILQRRFKAVKVTLIPALVQGDQAPQSLLQALELSKEISADVLIIGRGGGSMEDLWAFNDENLARAIADHPIPVISAVGHEIDFTICDFTADLRAPTPSAAAELVVQNVEEILKKIFQLEKQLIRVMKLQINFTREKLLGLKKRLIRPDRILLDTSQKLDDMSLRLIQTLKQRFQVLKEKMRHFEEVLEALSPKKVMKRGFSIVTNSKGKAIFDVKELKINDSLHIDFFKGRAEALVTKKE